MTQVTNGEIEFRIYSGQSLLKAKQEYEGLISGAIDICGNAYLNGYQPWYIYSELVGFDKTYAEVIEILKKVRPIIERELDKSGIKLLWIQPAALISFYSNKGFVKNMDDFKGIKCRIGAPFVAVEKDILESTLNDTHWNKSQAARLLHISRPLLYLLIKKYDLKRAT